MRITSAGNVGIGTSSPAAKLDVRKDGISSILQIWRSDLGVNDRNIMLTAPTTDSANEPFTFQTGNSIAFKIDSIDALTLNSAGNVGIGTSSPSAKLVVQGTTSTREQLVINAHGGLVNGAALDIQRNGVSMGKVDADYYSGMRFYVTDGAGSASSERLRITSAGNVGIGTTTPGSKLDINGCITHSNSNNDANVTTTRSGVMGAVSAGTIELTSGSAGTAVSTSTCTITWKSLSWKSYSTEIICVSTAGQYKGWARGYQNGVGAPTMNTESVSGGWQVTTAAGLTQEQIYVVKVVGIHPFVSIKATSSGGSGAPTADEFTFAWSDT
jgi:hypothetical protein